MDSAPYFINPASLGWSAKYGYIWFGSNIVLAIFTWFFLPEPRDRTLEEIHEMFENKVPARQFKNYVCVGIEGLAAEAVGKDIIKRDSKGGALHIEGAAD